MKIGSKQTRVNLQTRDLATAKRKRVAEKAKLVKTDKGKLNFTLRDLRSPGIFRILEGSHVGHHCSPIFIGQLKVFPVHKALALSAASLMWAKVTQGSCLVIDRKHFVPNGLSNVAVKLWTKVYLGAKNLRQILAVNKVFQAQLAQSFGIKLRQYIDIAASWMERK